MITRKQVRTLQKSKTGIYLNLPRVFIDQLALQGGDLVEISKTDKDELIVKVIKLEEE